MIGQRLPKVREQVRKSLRNHGEQPGLDLDQLTYTEDQILGGWLPDRA
jgi:hypothetical protein